MVLYFTPIGTDVDKDDWKIYMGRDKYENEDLIKYGLPHDVWYAASKLYITWESRETQSARTAVQCLSLMYTKETAGSGIMSHVMMRAQVSCGGFVISSCISQTACGEDYG